MIVGGELNHAMCVAAFASAGLLGGVEGSGG